MVPLLLPCATTGLSSIAAWCGSGAPPRGQQWPPACTLPHVRDGLRVRSRATFCPCGRSSMRRPAHRQFLRNALPDLTTIAPVTAYYRINYVRDTVGLAWESDGVSVHPGLLRALLPVRSRYASWTQNLSHDPPHACGASDTPGVAACDHHPCGAGPPCPAAGTPG